MAMGSRRPTSPPSISLPVSSSGSGLLSYVARDGDRVRVESAWEPEPRSKSCDTRNTRAIAPKDRGVCWRNYAVAHSGGRRGETEVRCRSRTPITISETSDNAAVRRRD